VLADKEFTPQAVLFPPLVFAKRALVPMAVLLLPDVLAFKAEEPTATFEAILLLPLLKESPFT